MMQLWQSAMIVVAGTLAAIVGTAGGITSLISYPALLAVGVPPVPANIANIVALVACWPGAAISSRPELVGSAGWLRRWSWVAAAGGAIGSALLLSTPAQAFRDVVPFLVAAGSVILLLQPKLSAQRHGDPHSNAVLGMGLLSVSAYNGYFGAGSGVMTLGLMLLTVDEHVARANALKNMVIGAATVVSALTFVLLGPVDWAAVVPLAVGMLAGSMVGPLLTRRIPGDVIRWFAALLGFGLAIALWVSAA